MKTLADLEAIRAKALENMGMRREDEGAARVVVGMATCGIAAGARPVMLAFVEELKQHHKVTGHTPTLKYLVMGGRLNPVVGKVGAALNIRPMLKIEGGEISQAGLCRGAAKTRSWYVEQLKQFPPDKRYPIILAGADYPAQVAELRQLLEGSGLDLPEIRSMEIGCIIGTHVGPDLTLATWIQA